MCFQTEGWTLGTVALGEILLSGRMAGRGEYITMDNEKRFVFIAIYLFCFVLFFSLQLQPVAVLPTPSAWWDSDCPLLMA